MSRRRWAVALVLSSAGLLLMSGALLVGLRGLSPASAAPTGWVAPRALPKSAPLAGDRLVFDSDRSGHFELFTIGTSGGTAQQLTDDRPYDSWSPRLSPDRRTVLFYRSPAGVHDRDYHQVSLWATGADGSGTVQLRPAGLNGWPDQGHAEWSPDGHRLVMFGGSQANPQIFLTDPLGQHPTALTNRPGNNLDPSFSSDGSEVLFVGCPGAICFAGSQEVYRIPVTGGATTRLTDDDLRDNDPTESPDGTQTAWLTNIRGGTIGVWDIRIRRADGSTTRLVNDAGITSRPEYSADGSWIYFHRIPPRGSKFDLYRAHPDGTGLMMLTSGQPGNNEYPAP